jgi:hypothetical protein
MSRLRCSGVASTYGWVTILLYCLWLKLAQLLFLTGYGPTLSSDSLTARREIRSILLSYSCSQSFVVATKP